MDHAFYIAAIMGIVQVFKMSGIIPNKFGGVLALSFGVLFGLILGTDTGHYPHHIMMGVMYGLSASGAWSTPKNVIIKDA